MKEKLMKVSKYFQPRHWLLLSFLFFLFFFFLGGSAEPLKPKLQWQCGRVGVRKDNAKVKASLLQSPFNLGRSGETQSLGGISVEAETRRVEEL